MSIPANKTILSTIGLGLAAAVTLGACSNSSPAASTGPTTTAAATAGKPSTFSPPTSTVALQETGSSLMYPLFNLWAPAYKAQYPNITITPQSTGSGAGISQAIAGTVDIGASDAYLTPAQLAPGTGTLNIPLAISAQQINYNIPGLSASLKLDGKVLSAIYQGKIVNWNDPAIAALNNGVSLPNLKIVPIHRSDGSGDTFIFSQYLSKADPNGWGATIKFGTTVAFPAIASALAENGNGGMVTGCATTPGCVAYIGVSFSSETKAKSLGQALLANAAGNYEALTASTVDAEVAGSATSVPANEALSLVYGSAPNGYPIVNFEYGIVKEAQPSADKAQAVKAFMDWAISSTNGGASKYLGPVGFRPLPAAVVRLSQAQISQIS
ncbi:MAG: phosphate ABC transporter substrate-binding protein PstS [Acidimicrobiales bacterium]